MSSQPECQLFDWFVINRGMSEMVTNRVDVNNLLAQMREMKAQAMNNPQASGLQPRSDVEAAMRLGENAGVATNNTVPSFSQMFSNAVNSVNETQQTSSALARAYEQGDPGVTLSQVMVASQKASVSFQALTQVRNKLVDAYKDVMNMPI
jgi:flagellar hook-basal body complex protein FliE